MAVGFNGSNKKIAKRDFGQLGLTGQTWLYFLLSYKMDSSIYGSTQSILYDYFLNRFEYMIMTDIMYETEFAFYFG